MANESGSAKPLRILFLTPAITPDNFTAAARAGRFRRHLSALGHEVDVISEGSPDSGSSGVWRIERKADAGTARWLNHSASAMTRLLANNDMLPWASNVF